MGTPPENVETTAPAATEPAGRARQDITPQQLLIVVGVLVVLLLVLVYFFFLRGGGEEEVAAPPVAEGVPAPEETTAPEDEDADDGGDEGDVENFDVFAPRDPFKPLVTSGEGGGGAAAPDDGTGDGDIVTPDDGGEAPPTDDGDRIGNHRVRVVDVYVQNGRDRAQIQVDGTVYTVDEGEQFADNFELVSASGRCATILFGDDEFTLCEGEEILK